MTPLTITPRPMRIRAAALTLCLAALLLPAVASAQQLAIASTSTIITPAEASSAAPMTKRDRVSLESRLQHVALLQELYWTEHHTYTTNMAALEPSALTAPQRVEIVSASAEGWTARAELPSRPGFGCVLTVGAPDRSTTGTVAASGGTARGKRLADPAAPRPTVVCDR